MKRLKKGLTIVILLAISLFLVACSQNESKEEKIAYRFADKEEGASLILNNTEYYNNFSQNDMDYRAQKKGATLDEVKEFAANQVLEFSEQEKKAIDEAISTIESILKENGYVLPKTDEIVFVRTTTLEEGGAEGYTHKTEIYFGDIAMNQLLSDDEAMRREGIGTVCHEIFHCLTRNNSQFRADMYNIINFKIQDNDFEMGSAIKELSFSNPDVAHHDSYTTFTVNCEKKDCFMVLTITQPFEKEGDNFTDYLMPVFVPVDDTNTYYSLGVEIDPKEFASVFGQNTGYAIDPEECMADNFSYAIVYGKGGIEGQPYATPEMGLTPKLCKHQYSTKEKR